MRVYYLWIVESYRIFGGKLDQEYKDLSKKRYGECEWSIEPIWLDDDSQRTRVETKRNPKTCSTN